MICFADYHYLNWAFFCSLGFISGIIWRFHLNISNIVNIYENIGLDLFSDWKRRSPFYSTPQCHGGKWYNIAAISLRGDVPSGIQWGSIVQNYGKELVKFTAFCYWKCGEPHISVGGGLSIPFSLSTLISEWDGVSLESYVWGCLSLRPLLHIKICCV